MYNKIYKYFQNLSNWVVGWIDWNMALNEQGAPNWAKNFVDSPIIVISQSDEFYKQPMFYAISHFSKFVPSGSYRIFSTGLENNQNIKTIAFVTPKEQIVVVAINKLVEDIFISNFFRKICNNFLFLKKFEINFLILFKINIYLF